MTNFRNMFYKLLQTQSGIVGTIILLRKKHTFLLKEKVTADLKYHLKSIFICAIIKAIIL